MLTGTLTLYDIRDVEAFVTRITASQQDLTHHQREDLAAYLIAETWELSLRYQPGRIAFSTYAGNTLRQRIHDHTRHINGRTRWQFATHTHERQLPTLVSFDALEGDRLLGDPDAISTSGPQADRGATLERLDRERRSCRAHDAAILRARMCERVAA